GQPPARGGFAGRADGSDALPRLLRGQGRERAAARGRHPRHGARDEPRERDDGRLQARRRQDRRARQHRRRRRSLEGRTADRGPGGGPVAVRDILEPFLPVPVVVRREDGSFDLDYDRPKSIGKVRAFTGPFGVFVRSYAFIRAYGPRLKEMSEVAVLNANYLLARLKDAYELPFDRLCMHEFVISARNLKRAHGITALDVAKRLMDYGFHPPTIYFPLIVPEALMIEPTETETKETLDEFVEAMLAIAREAREAPELLKEAPHNRPVRRLDEVKAAKRAIVRYGFEQHPDLTGDV